MSMTVVMLWLLVIYVTLVYAPIAAWLVELFPSRIRYSGMSLPYHIGNGWFGGFLPATVFAIAAATGNIYSGLWYPVGIAIMSLVSASCSCRKPRTSISPRPDIHAAAKAVQLNTRSTAGRGLLRGRLLY